MLYVFEMFVFVGFFLETAAGLSVLYEPQAIGSSGTSDAEHFARTGVDFVTACLRFSDWDTQWRDDHGVPLMVQFTRGRRICLLQASLSFFQTSGVVNPRCTGRAHSSSLWEWVVCHMVWFCEWFGERQCYRPSLSGSIWLPTTHSCCRRGGGMEARGKTSKLVKLSCLSARPRRAFAESRTPDQRWPTRLESGCVVVNCEALMQRASIGTHDNVLHYVIDGGIPSEHVGFGQPSR